MGLRLRLATLRDSRRLLEWRNDRETVANSHNHNPVNLDDHLQWMIRSIISSDRFLYIAEMGGVPVGTVRADRDGDGWELSWTVRPDSRRMGIAKLMVRMLAENLSGPVRAEIKPWNTASIRVAEFSGMSLLCDEGGVLHYSRGEIETSKPRYYIYGLGAGLQEIVDSSSLKWG